MARYFWRQMQSLLSFSCRKSIQTTTKDRQTNYNNNISEKHVTECKPHTQAGKLGFKGPSPEELASNLSRGTIFTDYCFLYRSEVADGNGEASSIAIPLPPTFFLFPLQHDPPNLC